MEVGSLPSSAGSRRGGGDREEEARGSGGAMRDRVCARVRTPQGVGALLIVGGAIVGAAVFAWRRHCDRKKAKNHQHRYGRKKNPSFYLCSLAYDSCCCWAPGTMRLRVSFGGFSCSKEEEKVPEDSGVVENEQVRDYKFFS
jgi:hypothetical protein